MKKTIIRAILLILGTAVTINGICVMIYANLTVGTFLTLLLGLALLLPAVLWGKTAALLKKPTWKAAAAVVISGFGAMLLCCAMLFVYGINDTVKYNEDYLVVLGCGVHGDTPSLMLKARLDKALEYLEKNNDCTIIVTGGQGPDENIPEAEAMRRYLTAHGVSESRIIAENKSTSTSENFRFSNALVNGALANESVAMITTDFHIYRAEALGGMQDIHPSHLSSKTEWYNIIPSYMRELLAIAKMYILKY